MWIKKNWGNAVLITFFLILLLSPDAKAWWMRQIISTGLFNSKIEEKPTHIKEAPILFKIKNENGETIETSQLRGKVVFINFWASWCPPCRAEFPSIQKFYGKYQSNPDIRFLTVNLDDNPGKGKDYMRKEQYTIPFFIPDGDIPKEYFNGSLPTTVVLDKEGKIRLHHSGMADYSKNSFYQQIDRLLKE